MYHLMDALQVFTDLFTDPDGVLCSLRAWSVGMGQDVIVRHVFDRVEL
jgi:hypothetical protein